MALGKCRECGRECATSAKVCPGCGVGNPVKGSARAAALGLVFVALVIAWAIVTSGSRPSRALSINPVGAVADLGMDGVYKKVSSDAVAQYEITKRGGAVIDICVHAGMVAAAFLQAKDEANYRIWKATELADCAKAGVPAP